MNNQKIFLSLTTIPPRIKDEKFLKHVLHLKNQTETFEKLYITLVKDYKRFPNENLEINILNKLEQLNWIEIIWLEQDFGPACKFLGPLIKKYNNLDDNILIIIDDDRYYDVNMIKIYKNFFKSHSDIYVASGNQFFYFNGLIYNTHDSNFIDIRETDIKYPAAFMSFAISFKYDWKELINYTIEIINNVEKSFFHDEGILLNFFKFKKIRVFYITFKFINYIKEEMTNSLVNGNFVNRQDIENNILEYTNKTNLLKIQYVPIKSRRRNKVLFG